MTAPTTVAGVLDRADAACVYYKATRPDGTSFYDQVTRWEVGATVSVPAADDPGEYRCCSSTVLHASDEPGETLVGGSWPRALTGGEVLRLGAAWAAAWAAARGAAWAAAPNAARGAALALLTEDLLTEDQFTALVGPWMNAIGLPDIEAAAAARAEQ